MSSLFNLATVTAAGGHRLRAGYRIDRSVRFRSSASASFSRTPAGAGSVTTWTWSAWVKRGSLGGSNALFGVSNNSDKIWFSSDQLSFYIGAGAAYTWWSAALFRDPSAWYHIVVVLDTTNATSTDRVRVYVNGVRATANAGSTTYPTQNYSSCNFNTAVSTNIGRADNSNNYYYDGYLTEVNFIDGQALDQFSFGETNILTGVWQPKRYSGTYGTNGFYLNFSDNSAATAAAIGKDSSGNGNNWTPNNISVSAGVTYDSMLDSPTQFGDGGNGRGNYATLNPLSMYGTNAALAGGSLTSTASSSGNDRGWPSTIAAPGSGKWYAEFTFTATDGDNNGGCGIMLENGTGAPGESATTVSWRDAGTLRQNASGTSYGSSLSAGNIVMVAYDAGLGRVWFGKNGTWFVSGDPATNANPSATGITTTGRFATYHFGVAATIHANFGQRPFSYTPPTGFKALNTLNLPQPTILKGNQYFDIALYNNATVVSGLGFSPDLVWHKSRNQTYQHYLYDKVRGVGPKGLNSSSDAAEGTNDSLGIVSFDSSGVTYSSDAGLSETNAVGWFWKEGATPGFDIVTYTGTGSATTVAHSLGVTPSMIIVKERGNARFWFVNHTSLSATQNLYLNGTDSVQSDSVFTSRSSTTFGVGSGEGTNGSGQTYVAYLWSEVAGFSKFGSYTGNGSADGPFVFCGFRPKYVMIKGSSFVSNWFVIDASRSAYNVSLDALRPNLTGAEVSLPTTTYSIDILSNGFKLRTNAADSNTNAATFIFAAFAEHPFKNALAR